MATKQINDKLLPSRTKGANQVGTVLLTSNYLPDFWLQPLPEVSLADVFINRHAQQEEEEDFS